MLCSLLFLFVSQGYGRPILETQESIDAVYKPDKMFQMTVSTTKEVKLNGLNQCIEGMRGAPDLFIVVPQMRYRTFTNMTLAPTGSSWPDCSMGHRYVLSIPLRPGRTREQLLADARQELVDKQRLDATAVDGLLENLKNNFDDLDTLSINGIELKQRTHASWTEVGKFPAANPVLHVYKQKTGAFVALHLR
jgi:hypothetical protein